MDFKIKKMKDDNIMGIDLGINYNYTSIYI